MQENILSIVVLSFIFSLFYSMLSKLLVVIGIRDISSIVKLPKNTFYTIDDKAVDYDDMRCCNICKNACIFSAVACECDKSKVACSRHFHAMCKCPKEKKFLLGKV